MQDMVGRVRQRLCHLNANESGDHTVAVDVCHICRKWTCDGHLEEVPLVANIDECGHFCPQCLEDTTVGRQRLWDTFRGGIFASRIHHT